MNTFKNLMIRDIICSLENYSERTAFVIQDKEYTYSEVRQIIQSVIYSIPFQNKRIGIVGENDIHTYASILAVLISGNTYVILHPSYPDERNRKIIASADIDIVLGCGEKPDYLTGISYNSVDRLPEADIDRALTEKGSAESEAYIIFTSGSTGEPKGVPISRLNLDAFYTAYTKLNWNLDEKDRMLQMFELTFDVSVVSFLYPLTLGATVYTVGHKEIKHFKVVELLEEQALTYATVTPSLLQLLSPYFEDIHLPHLKYLIVTAEASQVDVITKFRSCAPNATFINLYGPTEATIYCCAYNIPLNNVKAYNGMIAIGRSFAGTEIQIVDENGEQVRQGEQGELLVCGQQVMNGYLDNLQKTQDAIIEMHDGKRFYKTGDLCYLDEEGDIFYCGRKDHQVKIQGFRVELSEIENTARKILKHSRNILAVAYNQNGSGNSIALVIEGKDDVDTEGLKLSLSRELPYYMIPREIKFLDKIPVNNSNKIDRTQIKRLF